jgi:site-specific recombinase XerD
MRRNCTESLLNSTQNFFQKYLCQTRGASAHTVRAYRDALKLFFLFLAGHEHKPVAGLTLDDIRANTVLAFLEHIESKRRNSAITRNCRLAAVRSFVQYLLRHDVTRAGQYGAILAIKTKRATRRTVTYLEPEEARALIAAIDARSRHGDRDRALLLFLYNTGARVAEALSLRSSGLHLDRPRQVRLLGKECHSYCISFRRRNETTIIHVYRQAYDLAFSSADLLLVVRTGIGLGPYTDMH